MPKISIYLPDEDNEKLERMAETENRSVSNMVATLVKDGFFRRVVVKSVDALPPPEGAQIVPVITIAEAQQ